MSSLNDNDSSEIELKDLFNKVIYSWRKILIVAIVFTLLCSGYKYFSGLKLLNNDKLYKIQEDNYQNILVSYKVSKISLENEVANLTSKLESQKNYNENSILMNINPYNVQEEIVGFHINTNYQINPTLTYQNIDKTDMVIRSYLSTAQNGTMYNYIINNLSFKMELKYLKEIVTISNDYSTDMIFIRIINNDSEACDEISKLVIDCFNQSTADIIDKIAGHTLSIVNKSAQVVIDYNLEQSQNRNILNTVNYENMLTKKLKVLNTLLEPNNSLISKVVIRESAIKYGIFGFVLGIMLAVIMIIINFILSDKIYSAKYFKNRYNLKILGLLNFSSKKQIFGSVDRWLNRLTGLANVNMDENEAIKIISANIRNSLQSINVQNFNIMFTGTARVDKIENICNKVSNELKNSSSKFIYADNIYYSSKTIERIVDCEAIIIIEELNTSTNTEILKELEYINDFNKKILGAVLIS